MTVSQQLEQVAPSSPRPRHRYVRVRASWLATAVVAVVLGGVWHAISSYAPLTTGDTYTAGAAVVVHGVVPNRDVLQLPFAPGTDQVLRFSIRNDGAWPISVDGVRTAPGTLGLSLRSVRAVQRWERGLARSARLLVRLAPGEQLELEAVYRITGCGQSPDSSVSYDSLPVRWHAFGLHHVSDVPEPIVILSAPHDVPPAVVADCPD